MNGQAIDQDIFNVLGNLVALVNELKTILGVQTNQLDATPPETLVEMGGSSGSGGPGVGGAPLPEKLSTSPEEKKKKAVVDVPNDTPTVDQNKAEDIIEDNNTDLTTENIDEVAKALYQFLSQKSSTKLNKSLNSKSELNDQLNKVLSELSVTMKSIVSRQEESDKAISNILKGLGVAKEIEEITKSNNTTETVKKNIHGEKDLQELISYIKKSTRADEDSDEKKINSAFSDNKVQVNKSLKKILLNSFSERR